MIRKLSSKLHLDSGDLKMIFAIAGGYAIIMLSMADTFVDINTKQTEISADNHNCTQLMQHSQIQR